MLHRQVHILKQRSKPAPHEGTTSSLNTSIQYDTQNMNFYKQGSFKQGPFLVKNNS